MPLAEEGNAYDSRYNGTSLPECLQNVSSRIPGGTATVSTLCTAPSSRPVRMQMSGSVGDRVRETLHGLVLGETYHSNRLRAGLLVRFLSCFLGARKTNESLAIVIGPGSSRVSDQWPGCGISKSIYRY